MPQFRMQSVVRARDVSAIRAVCDGCDAARPREEHRHAASLWLLTAGAFELRNGRGRHVVDPTAALVLAPNAPYTIRHPAGPDVCLAIAGPIVDELAASGSHLRPLDARTHARVTTALAAAARGTADSLAVAEAVAELADATTAPRARAEASAHVRTTRGTRTRSGVHAGAITGRDRALAATLGGLLQLSFADATSVTDLAAAAGCSVFHACRVFRRVTGHTLHGYRRELRLRHALAMLIDGDEPLASISAHCGFATQSHLTNLVRSRFGVTPGQLRTTRRLP